MARADMQSFESVRIGDAVNMGAALASADALFQLGLQYSLGRDVDADAVTAHKWFNLAALRGNQAAKEYRSEIAADMTRAQVAEAQKRAREWLKGH
jgi:uncharacterized protein